MPDQPHLHFVETLDDALQFREWIGQPRTWLGLDTETGGLDWWRDRLRLVQIGDENDGWAIPWTLWGGIAKEALESYKGPIVLHNSKFDIHFLEHNGVKLDRQLLHDSMVMAGIVEPHLWKGLKWVADRGVMPGASAGQKVLKDVMSKNRWDWDTIPIDNEEYWVYGALDPVLAAKVASSYWPRVREKGLMNVYETEVAVAQVLRDMERRGMLIDVPYVETMRDWLFREEVPLRSWFIENFDFEPSKDAQAIKWFQKQGWTFTVYTEKSKFSKKKKLAFDKYVLNSIITTSGSELLSVVAKEILRFRDIHRNRVTYFEAFLRFKDDDDRIHSQINPMEARTARMSSERPNLQNIPARSNGKLVRRSFIAPPGHKLIAADFDQIEYRIMVSRSGEQTLIDAINNGRDLHTYMASAVWSVPETEISPSQRSVMKNANFAFLYGAGDTKFAGMAGITTEQARQFREAYGSKFPAVMAYMGEMSRTATTTGEVRTPYLGRRQVVPKDEPHKLLNYATQGEASDVLKAKLVELSMTPVGESLRLPIHDEILFEVPEDKADESKRIIENVMPDHGTFAVPLSVSVDIVDNWGEKYE